MRQALAVYFNRRLCALEQQALTNYSAENKPTLMLWWWPLSEPTGRYNITNWLGSWNEKQELVDDWDGKVLEQYPGYTGWYFGRNTVLPLVPSNGKNFATATAQIVYPQPPVPATTEIRWGHDFQGNGCWQVYHKSKGFVTKPTRFFVRRTDNPEEPYQGLFQYERGEKWISYGTAVNVNAVGVLVPEAQIKEVNW